MTTTTTTNSSKKTDDKNMAGCTTANGKTDNGKTEACGHVHEGKIVSISSSKLVMSGQGGKECSHTVAPETKVTCDGAVCKAGDLKSGAKIRLTTKSDDKHTAVKIESLKKNTEFAPTV